MNNLARSDVLILKITDPPRGILEALIKKGHAVVELREFDDVKERIARLAQPVLMVYCGGTEQQTTSYANKLASLNELANFPVVFVGRAIAKHDRMLSQAFRAVTVLEFPGEPQKILAAVQELSSAWEEPEEVEQQPARAPRPETKIVKTIERTIPQVTAAPDQTTTASNRIRPSVELSEQVSSIATQIFNELSELKVSNGALGGEQLARGIKSEQLEALDLLPSNPRLRYKVDHLLRSTDSWGRGHLSRVAFVNNKILNVVYSNQAADRIDSAKSAAILFASSFAGNDTLMRRDYSAPEARALKSEMTAKIRESASQIKQLDQKASEIVAEMANLLGSNKPSSEELYLMASSLLAADIVNRLCNAQGHWSPAGAYTLMRRIKSGSVLNIHPKVISCILLTLTEASNSEVSVLMLPRLPRQIRATLAEIRSHKKLPVSANEMALPLTQLQPGMTVAQPVMAFDGTTLLKSGLVLDNDLILRLWQLSSIKPLLIPMVVLSKNEGFSVKHDPNSNKKVPLKKPHSNHKDSQLAA